MPYERRYGRRLQKTRYSVHRYNKSSKGRIENYFRPINQPNLPDPPPRISLCDLPQTILVSILAYTRRFTWSEPLDFNLIHNTLYLPQFHPPRKFQNEPCFYRTWMEEHDEEVSYEGRDPDEPSIYPSFLESLMITRSLCQPARDVLYRDNSFVIRRSGPRGFMPLMRLSTRDLSSLTSLEIYLDVPHTLPQCQCRCDSCYPLCWSKPLAHSCNGGKCVCTSKVLSDWTRLCERLESVMHPRRLKLALHCEVASKFGQVNFDLVERVLAPLRKLPQLAQCSIRLTRQKFQRLKDIAQETVNMLTGRVGPSFPFNQLPADLRYQVLRQTDLIAPFPLVWTSYVPSKVYYHWRENGYIEPEWCNIPPLYPHNRRLRPRSDLLLLGPAWPSAPDAETFDDDDDTRWEQVPVCVHCYPGLRTGFSSGCKLWHFPVELFRVSREVAGLSCKIFFMYNRFMLLSFSRLIEGAALMGLGSHYDRLFPRSPGQAISMPGPIRPEVWQFIHNLEIVFRVVSTQVTHTSISVAQRNWEAFVHSLDHGGEVGRFNLRRLNLSIVIGFHGDSEPSPSELGWQKEIWRYIINPLDRVNTLSRFKVTVFETFRKALPWELGLSEMDRARRLDEEIDLIWYQGTRGLLQNLSMDGGQSADGLKRTICPKKWWWLQYGPDYYPAPEIRAHVV